MYLFLLFSYSSLHFQIFLITGLHLFPVPHSRSGATTEEQIRKNTRADELELDAEDVAAIREMAEALDS